MFKKGQIFENLGKNVQNKPLEKALIRSFSSFYIYCLLIPYEKNPLS